MRLFRGKVCHSNRIGDTCHFLFFDARGYLEWLVELEVQSHRWEVIPVDQFWFVVTGLFVGGGCGTDP